MNHTLRKALGLFYLALFFTSLVFLIKPGAAIFYWESEIDTGKVIQDGDAFLFRFQVNSRFFNPDTIIVFEDQEILEPGWFGPLEPVRAGTFAIKAVGETETTVLFVPTVLSNPVSNGYTYRISIRPHLVSGDWGARGFLLLMPGLITFIGSSISNPDKRRVLFGSPFGFVKLWEKVFDPPEDAAASGKLISNTVPRADRMKDAAVRIILMAYLYVFMEWVFLVTKSSFMDILSLGDKVKLIFLAGFAAALLSLLSLPVMFLIDVVLSPFLPWMRRYAYHLLAAFLGACLALIMIDNFTYTVLNFGIVHSKNLVRSLYALLFLFILISILKKITVLPAPGQKNAPGQTLARLAIGFLVLSIILVGLAYKPETNSLSLAGINSSITSKPNIILLSSDGINAENMSVYGYERDTTPFITDLARTSLLGENNFTNSAHSTGSDTSLLTGKLPFDTNVLYPPDTLKGSDRYEHLPGILKRAGYRTVSLGVQYYVDMNIINFQKAFDAVQCQENKSVSGTIIPSGRGYDDGVYLLATIIGRIEERLGHIFILKEMQNPFALVSDSVTNSLTDQTRVDCLFSYIDAVEKTGQPLFAHIHLMGTHGARFQPAVRLYSSGQEQDLDWMTDFYDDAILNFDMEVEQLVTHLKTVGQYDNTILVLYTDHGQKGATDKKLPLIIHFPDDQYAGVIHENTQNLDIAPTLLEYMGIQKPVWMSGSSLLGELDPARLIFAGFAQSDGITINPSGNFVLKQEVVQPPFYRFGGITVVQCQMVHKFDLVSMTSQAYEVVNHTNPCPVEILDSNEVIRNKLGKVLAGFGFDLPDNW